LNNSSEVRNAFLALLPTAEPITKIKPVKGNKKGKRSQRQKSEETVKGVDLLFPLVEKDRLYLCEDGGHILRGKKLLQLDAKNRELCEDLRLDAYNQTGKIPSRESVITVIDLLSSRARRTGEIIQLFNRIGEKDGRYYYDMADGRAIEIAPGSWKAVDAPVLFRQLRHQQPQIEPVMTGGDVWRFLDFFQLPEEQKLLFVVTLITCFIPRISHPAIHVSGCQGSGKSFLTGLVKRIIDPSSVILSVMPRKPEDLDLLFFRYKVLVLDNLSGLNADTCDRLCSLISGGVIEKRTLHTDLETTILKMNPVVLYSSIGSLHSRPDLTERTIIFELQRIFNEKRMEESEILDKFNEALPFIIGGIFDVLGHALRIFPDISLSSVPRMASFARWGYTIAEVMGGKGDQFLAEYAANSNIQSGELLERDTFFASIVETLDQPSRKSLSGSFNEVLATLMETATPGEAKNGYMVLQKDKTFPSARGFRKHLERIRLPLEAMGVTFKIDNRRTSQAKAFVTFTKSGSGDEKNPDVKF
jgi:hypothetical protein